MAACTFGQDTAQIVIPGRVNSPEQQKKPYVIMISVDGFRYDYAKKYNAVHLQQLAKSGVESEAMIPSFPSVTFPNHYTLVTGLYPSHHGLANNNFLDRNLKERYAYNGKMIGDAKWYKGDPLWVLAEQQHMLTASFYWVGSEAPINGIYPTYRYPYNEKISIENRIGTVMNWLHLPAERRPHLITFYFPEVDHAGHHFGPDAPETKQAVAYVDSAVNELNKAVKSTGLKVSFVFVSDHGMAKVDNEHPLNTQASIDTAKFTVAMDGVMLELYAKDKSAIQPTYEQLKKDESKFSVYLKSQMPAYLHYGPRDDYYNRIGDILLLAKYPNVFGRNTDQHKVSPATHGYNPRWVPQMQATFYAWGPAFRKGVMVEPFENVNVFPVVITILGINNPHKIDGKKQNLASKILK
ncbi:ectonucleotide pyrophosphatase/phosphodiesterase [Mucilaginibacter koreensis]